MTDSPPPTDLEDTIRKLREDNRALIHQRDELQRELLAHRAFVRLCAAVFPAVEGLKPQHVALYAAEKARPLAALSVIQPVPTPATP